MDTRKYIFENGVMKINPAYKAANPTQVSTVAAPNQALAIVSSTQDIMHATEAQGYATGKPMQLSDATTSSMQIMQDADFLNQFHTPQKLDGSQLLDGLTDIFTKYEVPIGLVNKLLALSEYKLNFIVDDSGSMSQSTDAHINQASQYIKQKCDPRGERANSFNGKMTRWEEAEDRLHTMIDMLAFIPCSTINIEFLNSNEKIILEHHGKSPTEFANDAHLKISQGFKRPGGGTPINKRLAPALAQSIAPTMHYLLTDGMPSDIGIPQLKELILHRANPKMNPLTFISCTDQDSEVEWMKEIEEVAEYTAELDDFEAEKREVLKDQGPGFPFSKGFWLLCQLVAAINPDDLDALDESVPFTKQTMDNLMGRRLTAEEYAHYFRTNPNSQQYNHLYNQFMREDLVARQIVPKNPTHANQNNIHPAPAQNQHPGFNGVPNMPNPAFNPMPQAPNNMYAPGAPMGFWNQQQQPQQPPQQPTQYSQNYPFDNSRPAYKR